VRLAVVVVAASLTGASGASTDEIRLATGETLRGEVIDATDERVVFEHAILGRLVLDAADVERIVRDVDRSENGSPLAGGAPPPAEAPGDAEAEVVEAAASDDQPADEGAAADEALETPEGPPPWNISLELGLNGTSGNTETSDVRMSLLVNRTTEALRTNLDAQYFFGQSDGETRTNRFTAGGRNDWLVPGSPVFYFVQARYDADEFQSWDQRITGGGGLGYNLLDSETLSLTARGGAGFVKEFGSIDESFEPEGIVGVDLSWQIAENQTLTAASTWFPLLTNASDYRVVASADWTLNIDHLNGIDFKLGVQDEYQSMVDPGIEHNDLKFYGALVFHF